MGNEDNFSKSAAQKMIGTKKRDWKPSYQGAYG